MVSRSDKHNRIEAILFALGKDVSLEELSSLSKLRPEKAKQIVKDLVKEYAVNESALTILDKGDLYKFTIRNEFLPVVSDLIKEMDLDKSTLETLAIIAWKHPALQADVIKIRHNKAYEHMKLLQEKGFVQKEKSGRTFKIKLTDKFFEYFDIPSHDAKEAFKKIVPREVQEEVLRAEDEIDRKEMELEHAKLKQEEAKARMKDELSEEQKAKKALEELETEGEKPSED